MVCVCFLFLVGMVSQTVVEGHFSPVWYSFSVYLSLAAVPAFSPCILHYAIVTAFAECGFFGPVICCKFCLSVDKFRCRWVILPHRNAENYDNLLFLKTMSRHWYHFIAVLTLFSFSLCVLSKHCAACIPCSCHQDMTLIQVGTKIWILIQAMPNFRTPCGSSIVFPIHPVVFAFSFSDDFKKLVVYIFCKRI